MSTKQGLKSRHDSDVNMGGKGDTKTPQPVTAGGRGALSRRAKKKANEQQRLKTNATRTIMSGEEAVATLTPPVTTNKRYQNSRQHSAIQKRDRHQRKGSEHGKDAARPSTYAASSCELQIENLPEDMRISRLLRRLASEQSVRSCLDLCDRLELVILDPPNVTYVCKSFDILSNTFVSILQAGHGECQERVAQLFGMMLYVLVRGSPDQSAFRTWKNKWLWQGKRLRRPILVALREALALDHQAELQLEPMIGELLDELQELLELTDSADVFVLVTDIIVGIACAYPECFEAHFSDVVDIVVGWQLERTQRDNLKLHCARVLLAFRPYWLEQRDVTLNLLDQFIEDIEGCWDDLEEDDHEQWHAGHRLFAALLTAVNSVFKCLHNDTVVPAVGRRPPLSEGFDLALEDRELFESVSSRIIMIVSSLVEAPSTELALDAICEFLMLRITLPGPSPDLHEVQRVIERLLSRADRYSDAQLGSLLHLLVCYVETDTSEQQTRTMDLLPLIMAAGTVGHTGFYDVRFRRGETVQRALLLLYHRVLTLKNVGLLQAAYGLVLDDLEDAVARLRRYACGGGGVRGSDTGNQLREQYRISFNLLVLSPLAMARNSIFIIWTLQDRPVLHVLLKFLVPLDRKLWASYGQLHHAVLLVAYHHCTANNNFVSSSNLLQAKSYGGTVDRFLRLDRASGDRSDGDVGDNGCVGTAASVRNSSPTADHFGLVLRFLGTILSEWTDTVVGDAGECSASVGIVNHSGPLLELLLDWCLAIVTQTERYHDVLQECADFNRLLTLVCTLSVDCGSASERIGLRCADCLDAVCQYASLHPTVYQAVAEACCVQLCSVYGMLRARYTVIFSRLPLRHSLRQVNAFTGVNRRRREEIRELKNVLYQSTSTELRHRQSAVLRMADLRALLNRVAFSRDDSAYVGEYLHELLTRSHNQPSAYGEMALRDLRCLIPWAQWEAAQLCVNHKLRTPFGKPQSTFLRIETIVKQCARILALSDQFPVRDIRTSIANQRHARILLGFLEALEKSIHNAAEGTAFALPAPEKPARTFFRVNAPTCAEWFTRIRTAVDLVALHCMEPEMVIRYSEAVLRELVAAGKTSDLIFEHMLMSLVWALLRNWESDALYGVYVWSKQLTGRKYTWIRMAAEEAAGHRETAAEGFRAILADPAGSGMDRHIRDFIVDQTIVSLLFTGAYRELYEFLVREERGETPRATIPLITITAEQIHSIIRYEETHDVSVIDISQWELVDLGTEIPNNFSCHRMICAVENSLSGIILQEQIDQRERMIEASTELIQCYLQECLLTKCREYLFQLTITNHILYKIAQRIRSAQLAGSDLSGPSPKGDGGIGTLSVEKFYGTLTLMRLLTWSEFLLASGHTTSIDGTGGSVGCVGPGFEGEQQNIDLRLDMVSIGRKEKNFALCRRELEKYYHKSNLGQRLRTLAGKPTLEQVAAGLTGPGQPPELWDDENLSRAVYEHCKWLYCQPGKRLDAIEFAACAASAIDDLLVASSTVPTERTGLAERAARFMLTLGDWLSGAGGQEPGEVSQASLQLASVQRLGTLLPPIDAKPLAPDLAAQVGACDLLVGSLLQGAAVRSPKLAKAWFQLGSWLYRWGKRVVEMSSGASTTHIDVAQVTAILTGPLVNPTDCERIAAILTEYEPGRASEEGNEDGADDGEIDLDSSATIGSIELLEALHRAMPTLGERVPIEQLHAIIDVWRNNHRAVYGYYEAAAEAYFRFLQLSTVSPRAATGPDDDGFDSERARSVTVTLRLLRLIVKHALGLKEVLEEGLATTPSEPWRVITPQLFARLAHHEPYVRRRVSELLCRVANDAPHLIIFPAVVGSVQEEQTELANVVNVLLDSAGEFDGEDKTTVVTPAAPVSSAASSTSGLASCFNTLLDILSREVPDTVRQVQTLVHELRRISLLWEELWVVSLQQIYAEYAKRVAELEGEYARQHTSGLLTEPRRALLAEKHRLLFRPLIFVLEQLYTITARPAETNHERQFQERYHRYIRNMIEKLSAPADFSRPIEGWERFRTLYTQLQARSQKRFAFSLRLADVSPNLQQLAHTAISMPGIDTTTMTTSAVGGIGTGGGGGDGGGHHRQSILIRSVDGGIQILPTKTRPKKLLFHGNDGRRYGYLSKGLEDLHLDERIMQFLSIANLMMTRSIDCNGNVTHYRAEHYSVIPLGPRSGLITWVDNTVPIFSLYKKWQQREAHRRKEAKEGGVGVGVLRPSELYYQKLNPLLHSHGMKSTDSRREWPLSALKQVLAELQQETPRDLLAKELWCHSATASSWRQVIRTYSLSLAVMSVIGYIIGLGDRHLDNVLVKLATGEIVHIDYNMCFEKGKTLRVPEKVPFRMTPNLEEALGVTGIEGTFRLACEHVLKSLKKGRETLLTLLEAFVYDPLVDWAISEEAGGGLPMTATDITVSTMTAATGPGVAALKTTATTSSTASKYISQAKKQLDREVTRDTLAFRFAECRIDWHQNRDELLQHLLSVQKLLADQRAVRSELRAAELLRASLSQQLQLIDEAEYLDTAFGSHPLANLAHRLSVRAKVQQEYVSVRDQLGFQGDRLRAQLDQYVQFRCAFENNQLTSLRLDACSERWELFEHSTYLVRYLALGGDVNDNDGNGGAMGEDASYVRYCCARTEVSELQRRAVPTIKRSVQLLVQYGELVATLEPEAPLRHPIARYADWYSRMARPESDLSMALETLQQIVRERREKLSVNAERAQHTRELVCFNSTDGASGVPCPIMQHFAVAQRIIELNRKLLLVERNLLDGCEPDQQLWTLVHYIWEQCVRLVHHDVPQLTGMEVNMDATTPTSTTKTQILNELLQVSGDYEGLQQLYECIEQDTISTGPNATTIDHLPWDSRFVQLLEHNIECVLREITVKELLRHWTDTFNPQLEFLPFLSLLDSTGCDGNSAPPAGSCSSTLLTLLGCDQHPHIDQIQQATQLQLWHCLPTTRKEPTNSTVTSQEVEMMMDHILALDDTSQRLAVLPTRRLIARHVRNRLAGRLPLAAAALVLWSTSKVPPLAGRLDTQEPSAESNTLKQFCRDRCRAALVDGPSRTDDLDQLEEAAYRYTERVLAETCSAPYWLCDASASLTEEAKDGTADGACRHRMVFLQQLRDAIESLDIIRPLLQAALAQLVGCSEVLRNRLAWATAAHPPLCPPELLGAFERGTAKSVERVEACLRACEVVGQHANAVLRLEETRFDSEDAPLAQEFSAFFERWQKLLASYGLRATFVSPTEEALVELLDPEGSIDHTWISNVRALIDDMTDQALTKIAQLEQDNRTIREALLAAGRKLNGLTAAHSMIAGDIRALLRTQLRIGGSPALRDYLQRYRCFLELLQDVRDALAPHGSRPKQDNPLDSSNDQHQQATSADGTVAKVDELLSLLHDVFDQLFTFERPNEDILGAPYDDTSPSHHRQRVTDFPTSGTESQQPHDKKDQKQKEQKRNAYAVSVWRRIRMKLEGRDPDPNRRYGIPEQVSWMIQEAVDPNNLAVLYEGWTPWV